jgi:hypothetical protein
MLEHAPPDAPADHGRLQVELLDLGAFVGAG